MHYTEQGLWGVVSALVSCSPWLLCIFLLAFYHTCWAGSTLLLQLYQVSVCGCERRGVERDVRMRTLRPRHHVMWMSVRLVL